MTQVYPPIRSAFVSHTIPGIPRASENFNVNQILENYLPTIFATLVEPFWVLLNRFLCVLQPFKELWGGKAGTSNSIDTTYTSIPPQLVVWRALKNKHFLLAVVCVVSLLGNVLAVGLSALFNEKPVRVIQETTARPLLSTTFDNETVSEFNTYMMEITTRTSYTDHMYIAMANITTGNKLPAWVSEDYFFQPYEVAAASNLTTTTYNLITRGFGARGNCTAIPAATIPADINVADPANATDCHDPVALAKSRIRNDMNTQPTPGDAVEYVNTMTPASFSEAIQCDLPLTLAWGRTSKGTGKKAEIDATFAACRPTFETGMFNVTVDRDGTVLSYSPVGETSNTLDYPGSKRHTDLLMVYFNYQLNGDADDFHNDTLTRDWVNYLIYASTGSRGIVDPTKPLPEPSYFIPKVESIYRLLFATILGLNRQLFNGIEETSQNSTVTVRMTSSDTRIFMDGPAFIMTMVVLAINLIVAAVFYTKADALVLPRMPTTIGSILAYVAPSRAVKDLDEKLVSQNSRTYSFGRYVGQDGDVHVGIELDPHVVPVEITSLKEPGSFRRRFTSNSGKSVDGKRPFRAGTWL